MPPTNVARSVQKIQISILGQILCIEMYYPFELKSYERIDSEMDENLKEEYNLL